MLTLHSYDRGYTDDFKLDRELHTALESSAHGRVEYYSEYLDTNQFPGENQALILRDYFAAEICGRGDRCAHCYYKPAARFPFKYRGELFPHTPIVFTIGATAPAPRMPVAGATGIVTANTFRETLDLALKLHPERNKCSSSAEH